MTPYYADPWLTVYHGDSRTVLSELPAESVHCVVTSPPYWGLRDYGTASWEGGDEGCDHAPDKRGSRFASPVSTKQASNNGSGTASRRDCSCGARRIDSQLGLEPTPEQYVENMVAVFREVRRVLRSDGTVWLNLGDSYASGEVGRVDGGGEGRMLGNVQRPRSERRLAQRTGLKPKDLVGIPWLVARALQEPYYAGRMKRAVDRRWLAAMIDGEGTISGFHHIREDDSRPRTGAHLYITNSDTRLLDEAARIWPASRSEHHRPGAGHLGTRTVWRWIVHGIENKTLAMRELYPYLIAKRRQALFAYNLLTLMADAKRLGHTSQRDEVRDKRRLLVDLISRANHGETADVPSWCVEPPSVLEPGWYLRSDIIWSKPNPMPESVTDRPTKSHEYIFLLSKSARYYFDSDAVREPHTRDWSGAEGLLGSGRSDWATQAGRHDAKRTAPPQLNPAGRNLRSVWSIATAPYPGAHFATFPPKLVEPCIKAGTSEKGVCPECGAPWVRVVERIVENRVARRGIQNVDRNDGGWSVNADRTVTTTGWEPSCPHISPLPPQPATVLDPFAGSGTTGMVAQSLSRHAVLIDLSMDYLGQLLDRNRDIPLGLGA